MSCTNYNNINRCTLDTLTRLNISVTDNYIKDNLNLCELQDKKDTPTTICPLTTNSPWFQYDTINKKCTANINNNVTIPPNIITRDDKDPSKFKFKSSELLSWKPSKAYCENKWYDWFVIPNYHLNNYYIKDDGFGKEDDKKIYKCYKPCKRLFIPYVNSSTNENVCIPKIIANGGMYKDSIDFSPLALIMLIGSINQDLCDHFKELQKKAKESSNYKIRKTFDDNQIDVDSEINVINSKGGILDSIINDNYIIGQAQRDITDTINNNILINNNLNSTPQNFNDDNKKNFENAILTYATKTFIEPDINIQESMHNLGLFNEEYLDQCYAIAYYTYNANIAVSDIYHKYMNNDNKDFIKDYDRNKLYYKVKTDASYAPAVNYAYNIYYRIAYKLNLNLDDKYDFKKIKRLANIFKKASNICFDGKTNFSKYIMENIKLKVDPNKSNINLSYEDYQFDPEFNDCKNNEIQNFDIETKIYTCVKDGQVKPLIQQDTKQTLRIIHQQTNPLEFFKLIPDFFKLIYDSYYYLNILFVVLILILLDILTDGFVRKIVVKLINFIYMIIRSIFVFIWDFQYILSGTVLSRYEKDIAESDSTNAMNQQQNVNTRIDKVLSPPKN